MTEVAGALGELGRPLWLASDPCSLFIKACETHAGFAVPSLARDAVKGRGLPEVLCGSSARGVTVGKLKAAVRLSIIACLCEERGGNRIILCYAGAGAVEATQPNTPRRSLGQSFSQMA